MSYKKKAYYFLIGFFCFYLNPAFGQDQKIADSLIKLYESGSYAGDKLDLLRNIAQEETDPERQLYYSEVLIQAASKDSLFDFLHSGHMQKGYAMHYKGEFDSALESFFVSINYANRIGYDRGAGAVTISIADVYSEIGNANNAELYYNKGIQILRKTDDSVSLATALLNAGDQAFQIGKYDLALTRFEESGKIFEAIEYSAGVAYNLGNIGLVYAEQGKDALAEENINEAIAILEESEDYYPISVYLTYMSDIYLRKDNFPEALKYAERSLELATLKGLKDQISEANLKLSQLHEANGDLGISYKYYKDHIVYRDSVKNIAIVEQMADQRTDYEVSQKQVEVDLLNQQKKTQQIVLALIGLLLLTLVWFFWRISKEKKKSERLLLNILPEETAKELKVKGSVEAKKYDAVTVLFTDFKGFTNYSEKLSPEALVETVSFYFSKFDAIIEKYDLEKIKTIGDAYMCAGGLHSNKEDHAFKMMLAAFEIAQFVETTKNDVAASELTFDIRIGINTGPVVAGVVGTKKFAYDIWGDAVNVASRMESMSEPGKINISENTYKLIKGMVACDYRGEIPVKNRGSLKMYFAREIIALPVAEDAV